MVPFTSMDIITDAPIIVNLNQQTICTDIRSLEIPMVVVHEQPLLLRH